MSVWSVVIAGLGTAGVIVAGLFAARATRAAAAATAEATRAAALAAAGPAQRAEDLKVLQATVARLDEENGSMRGRQSRLESLLRAFAWTTDRWAQQMHRAGVEPEPVHPLVDEYNRTGV